MQLNAGAVGFYRVHYTPRMLDALLTGARRAGREPSLPRFDRYAVVSDLCALVCTVQYYFINIAF